MEFKDFKDLSSNLKNNFNYKIIKLTTWVASQNFIERISKRK